MQSLLEYQIISHVNVLALLILELTLPLLGLNGLKFFRNQGEFSYRTSSRTVLVNNDSLLRGDGNIVVGK